MTFNAAGDNKIISVLEDGVDVADMLIRGDGNSVSSSRIAGGAALETGKGGFILADLNMAGGSILDLAGTNYLNVLGSAVIDDNIQARMS